MTLLARQALCKLTFILCIFIVSCHVLCTSLWSIVHWQAAKRTGRTLHLVCECFTLRFSSDNHLTCFILFFDRTYHTPKLILPACNFACIYWVDAAFISLMIVWWKTLNIALMLWFKWSRHECRMFVLMLWSWRGRFLFRLFTKFAARKTYQVDVEINSYTFVLQSTMAIRGWRLLTQGSHFWSNSDCARLQMSYFIVASFVVYRC